MSNIKHYGWEVSPYTAKTRSYLTYKNIPFQDIVPSIRMLTGKIERDVGQMIMPVIYDNQQPLSDSTEIIEHFESKYPGYPVKPHTPKQTLTALFFELYADEWMPLAALHYRWNYPKNRPFILSEFGRSALPWLPKFLQKLGAKSVAGKMSGYLPVLGISDKMQKPLEENTESVMRLLDEHFKTHTFILGDHPTIADFSLFGPHWAHLDRDPYPENLVTKYEHLKGWIERMKGGFENHRNGQLLSDDLIPATLESILKIIAQTILPLIRQSSEAIKNWVAEHPDAEKLPRAIGKATLNINGEEEKRLNLTYPYWMFQRIHQVFENLDEPTRSQVLSWLDGLSPEYGSLLQTPLPVKVTLRRCRLWLNLGSANQASKAA